MFDFTDLIREDMAVSLGVTEPGAIAFAAAKARSLTEGEIERVELVVNSGIYKNSFSCGIPGTDDTGAAFAAMLGAVAGDPEKKLMALDGVRDEEIRLARELVAAGRVEVKLGEISPRLFLQATVRTASDTASVTITDAHTNITRMTRNGEVLFEKPAFAADLGPGEIASHTVAEFWEYAKTVPVERLAFIQKAYDVNLALAKAGADCRDAGISRSIRGGDEISFTDAQQAAQALLSSAIEARVLGLDSPAMSITGSGNHGIICTMPLYAAARVWNSGEEALLRATAVSYLITMYIKEYSGKLSAFCGCAIAAGTGAACGLLFLRGGRAELAEPVIRNMAAALTGIICTGGNPACVLKAGTAVDAAFRAVSLAENGVCVGESHGISGDTAEKTMQNMGRIASPGMIATEGVIVEILKDKT